MLTGFINFAARGLLRQTHTSAALSQSVPLKDQLKGKWSLGLVHEAHRLTMQCIKAGQAHIPLYALAELGASDAYDYIDQNHHRLQPTHYAQAILLAVEHNHYNTANEISGFCEAKKIQDKVRQAVPDDIWQAMINAAKYPSSGMR